MPDNKKKKAPVKMADGGTVLPLKTTEQQLAETGQADAATQAPENVNVFNPNGELVSIPAHQMQDAVNQGFRPASDQEVHHAGLEQKYGSTGQEILTGLEGVGRGLAGPLSTAAELSFGVPREDILGREETNVKSNILGEGLGLVGGAFVGSTEARGVMSLPKVAEMAANAGASKLLPQAATGIAKIGSLAVKGAIENAVIQGSDEVSKMILRDPEQTMASALVDVGLAGVIGAGVTGTVGAVPAIWKATLGKKTEGLLSAISDKLGGIEGVNSDVVDRALDTSGMAAGEISPEIRAALSQNPQVRQQAQILMDSATGSGLKYQEALQNFKKNMKERAVEIIKETGHHALYDATYMNANEIGDQIKEQIEGPLATRYAPIANSFEKIAEKFRKIELPQGIKTQLSEDVSKLVGDGVSPESPAFKLTKRVMKETNGLTNLEQLRNYRSDLMKEIDHFSKPEYSGVAKSIRSSLDDAEENTLNWAVEHNAPELLTEHKAANAGYRELKQSIETINDRLRVPYGDRGVKTFFRNLKDMDPETVLARLNPSNKADIISELRTDFPEVANSVRDYHLSRLVRQSTDADGLNLNKLSKAMNDTRMSPQMRDFLLPQEAQQKLTGLQTLMQQLPEKIGKSGTPQGLDGLMSYLPATATGLATILTGHNLLTAGLVGEATKVLSRDAPDAARLGLLKFLGSDKPINADGFKGMVDYIHSALSGEKAISRSTQAVFKAGREVLPQALIPSIRDRERLDKAVQEANMNPNKLLKVGGNATHYLDDHAQVMGQTAATAVGYLNSVRPSTAPTTPLGKPLPVDAMKKAQYDRALSIAQQPLTVLDRLKKGTLVPSDVMALKSMYPAVYTKFVTQLTNEMVDHMSKGETIPYNTRLGLAIFMGQPLDGTMTPGAIQAAQMINAGPSQQQPEQGQMKPSQQGMHNLSKLPSAYQTQSQQREQARQKPSH